MREPFIAHSEEASAAEVARFERNACTPKVAVEIMRRNLEIDVRALLPTVSVPTVVAHCVDDPLVPVEHGRYLAERIPGARYVEFADAAHALPIECAADVNDLLRAHLEAAERSEEVR